MLKCLKSAKDSKSTSTLAVPKANALTRPFKEYKHDLLHSVEYMGLNFV